VLALLRKPRKSGFTALVPQRNGVALARVEQGAEGPTLLEAAFHSLAEAAERHALLSQVVREHGLHQARCTSLMDLGDYQLLMVESPEVPRAELRAAIRWRVRELIDFHVDDAMVDVFDAPPSAARGTQDHLYAVVARSADVQQRVSELDEAGVSLEVIDIPELALRNIVAQLPENQGGVAILYFGAQQGLIALIRESTLYLARTLEIGYQDLEHHLSDPQQVWDLLALEIQRSLDYYDRHFQQAPIASVVIAPLPAPSPGFAQGLHETLGLPVRDIQLEEVVRCSAELDPATATHCFLAVGAALRVEDATL
jgi:MSHA biogenesis protein MshI